MQRGVDALPGRFYDMQALFHKGDTEFSWDNGNATKTNSAGLLIWYIIMDWLLYIIYCYLVLICYSYFVKAKTWSSYSGYSLN